MLSITRHQIDYADRANHMLAELDTQLKIAVMLGYSTEKEEINENIDHLGRLLTGLFNKWDKE